MTPWLKNLVDPWWRNLLDPWWRNLLDSWWRNILDTWWKNLVDPWWRHLVNIWWRHLLVHRLSRAGKIRFSDAPKSVLLKASSGERCAPPNFVHLVVLLGTRVRLIVCLVVHQMKCVLEWWNNAIIFWNFLI